MSEPLRRLLSGGALGGKILPNQRWWLTFKMFFLLATNRAFMAANAPKTARSRKARGLVAVRIAETRVGLGAALRRSSERQPAWLSTERTWRFRTSHRHK